MAMMRYRLFIVSMMMGLTACFEGGAGFFKQKSSETVPVSSSAKVITTSVDGDGVVTGSLQADGSAAQTLSAAGGTELEGTSISFPPGSLAISTNISVELGAALASAGLTSELGLDNVSTIEAAGPAVVLSSSTSMDAATPFTLALPLSSQFSLAGDSADRLIIIYRIKRASDGKTISGVILRKDITIANGVAQFETSHFGSYQAALSDVVVESAKTVETTANILTKVAEKTLPELSWGDVVGTLQSTRSILFQAKLSGAEKIKQCIAFADHDKAAPWDQRIELTEPKVTIAAKSAKSETYNLRFECTDDQGRITTSSWSKAFTIPAKPSTTVTDTTTTTDTTAPTVTGVTASNTNGTYAAGAAISILVTFSEAVTVTGTPSLALETGSADRVANYAGGSGTPTITLVYNVVAGDSATDLDYFSTTALNISGATIKDSAGNNAQLTLPNPGAAGSLGANKAIAIATTTSSDTTAPTVVSVTSSKANGTYKAGEAISIVVTFSEAIVVTGTPTLTLATGATDRVANCTASTTILTCSYAVQTGDTSGDLNYATTTSLSNGGGAIVDAANNAAVLTLPALGDSESLAGSKNIVIDAVAPAVSNVTTSNADGSYTVGTGISIQVEFSEVVNVTGSPTLTLETGATDRVLTYTSGSGTNTLTFAYTVQANETSADLDYVSTAALSASSATIADNAGNSAVLTLPAPGTTGSLRLNHSIVVDTTLPKPSVTSFTVTAANAEVNLSWTVEAATSVLIVRSSTGSVTWAPTGGTSYASNQSLPGGLVVVYSGNATSFNDSSVSNSSTYDYKIWNFDAALNYSSEALTGAATPDASATGSITIKNAWPNRKMQSGFVVGTVSGASTYSVKVGFDGNSPAAATNFPDWSQKLPSMNPDNTFWQLSTRHRIEVRAIGNGGVSILQSKTYVVWQDENKDFDGDGYSDVAVSAGNAANTGRVYIYPGSSAGVSSTSTSTLDGVAAGDIFGSSLALAGDVNGDGYGDLVVGAYQAASGGTTRGGAYVYLGTSAGLDTTPVLTIVGTDDSCELGGSVASAGDVNGDGYADIVIGASGMTTCDGSSGGVAYIYYGDSTGAFTTIAPSKITSSTAGDSLGNAVASAGDVNGDGYSDVIVSAWYAASGDGRVYIHHGSSAGINTTASTTISGAAGNLLTTSVTGIGDINRDGYDDIILGHDNADAGGAGSGAAHIHYGSSTGISSSIGVTLSGAAAGDRFGYSVAAAGDLNGDGFEDVVIGAIYADTANSDAGKAYVYLGVSGGLSTTPAVTLTGSTASEHFGNSVAGGGDVNADGFSDFVLGSNDAAGGGAMRGQAFVYLGNASISSTPATTLSGTADNDAMGMAVGL